MCYGSDNTEELQCDKMIVMAVVVKIDEQALRYGLEELEGHKEVVMVGVEKHGHALKYDSKKFCRDKYFMMKAVEIKSWPLGYASEELKVTKRSSWCQ